MRKQFTKLEMDMAQFIRELIVKSDQRVKDGYPRMAETQRQYDKAVALVGEFDRIAKEIAGMNSNG